MLGLKTAFANEVSTTYEPSIAQKNTDSQAIDLITNQPNFSNAQNLTQTTEFIPSQPQEADSPKSNVQNPKSNETPLATTTSGVVPVAQVQINPNNLEQIQQYSNENSDEDPMGQVTNVSQFRDVQPSDWAYEALSRIVQNYGCLQGYPDSTYRGNRALSRYEFAAGL
ncbi:MAG TPA: S-layer homology domain-containing protein, partial [Candidatus Obscuribacterales bacterium]